MGLKKWDVELADGQHAVALRYDSWQTDIKIYVDRKLRLQTRRSLFDTGSDYFLDYAGQKLGVHVRMHPSIIAGYTYDLSIDGQSVSSGAAVLPLRSFPLWTWLFIAYSLLVAVYAALFGVPLAAIFGVYAALACTLIARMPERSTLIRAGVCTLVSFGSWIITLGISALVMLR